MVQLVVPFSFKMDFFYTWFYEDTLSYVQTITQATITLQLV